MNTIIIKLNDKLLQFKLTIYYINFVGIIIFCYFIKDISLFLLHISNVFYSV